MIEQKIAKEIQNYNGQCFYVGGYIRDKVLGIPSKDKDIECFNISIEDLEKVLSSFGTVLTIGKSFGVLKLANYPDIDFTLPRKEVKTGEKHTDFDILVQQNTSYKDAAIRRDFTCNALMENVLTGERLDFFNGIQHITEKKLVHIDDQTFTEDPLRGLRAAQFGARFNFRIAQETADLIRSLNYQYISEERTMQEFEKGLMSNNPAIFINFLFLLDIAPKLYPELQSLSTNDFALTLSTLQYAVTHAENIFILRITLLAYRLISPEALLKRITNRKTDIYDAKKYLQALYLTKNIQTSRDFRILHSKIENRNTYFMMLESLYIFDKTIIPTKYINTKIFRERYKIAIQNNPTTSPLIQGRELISLGYSPSQLFSQILLFAYNLELDGENKEAILTSIKKEFPLK